MISAPTGVQDAGFSTNGQPDGDGRRHLVRGEVQREVERRDEGDRADRHPLADRLVARGARGDVERHATRRRCAPSPRPRCGRCR